MLSDWPADPGEFGFLRFTTPTFTVNVGEPFRLELQLTAQGSVLEFQQSVASSIAISDFGSTLAFPTLGPVFNLPAGYTVDSFDAASGTISSSIRPQTLPNRRALRS